MQEVFFPTTGNYRISYLEAGRIQSFANTSGNLGYLVSVGGNQIHTDSTFTAQPFTLVEVDFFATAGTHTLNFEGIANTDGNGTSYFDAISINEASIVPVPAAVWLFGSGLIGLIAMAKNRGSAQI